MKIIIVDDDPFVCISLKTILQAEPGIEVCASGNSGEEAVRLYKEMLPDILLMDIQMERFFPGAVLGKMELCHHIFIFRCPPGYVQCQQTCKKKHEK